jgi:hypothetical protein
MPGICAGRPSETDLTGTRRRLRERRLLFLAPAREPERRPIAVLIVAIVMDFSMPVLLRVRAVRLE